MRLRTAKDIWQNLHEFYLDETKTNPEWNNEKIKQWLAKHLQITATINIHIIPAQKQMLTHQLIRGYFIYVELPALPTAQAFKNGSWLYNAEIKSKAFPRFINQFISGEAKQMQVL